MNQRNEQRALVQIVREICSRRGIEVASFSSDWVFCLQYDRRRTYIFGYDFGLNSATAKILCKDKSATSDLLKFHGIPRIEHQIFHSPQLAAYVPMDGNWRPMLDYFEAQGRDVVCKPNEGTGGRGVTRVRTPLELEAAVVQAFSRSRSLCLSPYEDIAGEYRVAVLRGSVEFIYLKRRPTLAGDGRRSVGELLLDHLRASADLKASLEDLPEVAGSIDDFSRVPSADEQVTVNWRHNLGQGSRAELLDPASPELAEVCRLALDATAALGVELASADVARTPAGLKILEINSGIMMENLARSGPAGWALAARFYDRIVCAALGLQP